MCGIFAVFHSSKDRATLRALALQQSKSLRHRGPDWSGIHLQEYKSPSGQAVVNVLAHERLAIVDPGNGAQPLFNQNRTAVLTVNGEIYNHKDIRAELSDYKFSTGSDCESILALYQNAMQKEPDQSAEDFSPFDLNLLDGVFAFVLIDQERDLCFAARDPIGIVPLYVGWQADGSICFSSELKALCGICVQFQEFKPGHFWCSKQNEFVRYYKPSWLVSDELPTRPYAPQVLHDALVKAVKKRLMCDVPFAVLLSGGLDSSIIASIIVSLVQNGDLAQSVWHRKVHTFSIGLQESPDLKAARKVADYLGTEHHECVFSIQQGLDALRDVIYHIESYDVTTIRASTPMYLLARYVKAFSFKMLFSGEGSDEALAGYLYFHHAPNALELHAECKRKLSLLSRYDCLRANKSAAAFGVEVRVPFLDKEFLNEVMTFDPSAKLVRPAQAANGQVGSQDGGKAARRQIEKFTLRNAFDRPNAPYLPDEVLWRQKEQFSDGVGYSWIDSLRNYAESRVSDEQLKNAKYTYPENTPATKEAYLYRQWFEELFPHASAVKLVPSGPSVACSSSVAAKWCSGLAQVDPSGRAVTSVHEKSWK